MLPGVVRACPGDCDDSQSVAVAEVVTSVMIALGTADLSACPNLDDDASGGVTIDENLLAVRASLDGCPPTPTPTSTATPTITPTPSPTVNQPPALLCTDVYRAFPDQLIAYPIPVVDPDGGTLHFQSDDLPGMAELDGNTGVLTWTPRPGDVGSYYIPYMVDDGSGPLTGQLAVQVVPLDECTIPVCDPATGCVGQLLPLSETCCQRPVPRLGEPVVSCPGSRAVHVGRNRGTGFGKLNNCEALRVTNFQQTGAVLNLSFEASCIDASRLVDIHVRVETATRLLFDEIATLRLQDPDPDGYARVLEVPFPVLGPGPFFEFEGAEAFVSVTLIDANGVVVETRVRPKLTFDIQPDVTDPAPVEPTITPDACLTPTPTPSFTRTSSPTRTASPTVTSTATVTVEATPTDTVPPTPTDTPPPTATYTVPTTPTDTPPPTPTDTVPPTPTDTAAPTSTDTAPATPTDTPTVQPTPTSTTSG